MHASSLEGGADIIAGPVLACAGFYVLVAVMRLIKVFFLFILLGGDYGLEPASLEAQVYGVNGTSPFLLCRTCFSGGTVFLIVTVFVLAKWIWNVSDLGNPMPITLLNMMPM